jgi:uncharacterized RDD family membrane protein YckC
MNCQNCEAPVSATAERCEKCGAKLLHRRVVFGAPRVEQFALTPEDESTEIESTAEHEEWKFPPQREISIPRPALSPLNDAVPALRYGGFFRRLVAAIIDLVMVLLLSAVMGVMAYIGYKVGLSAHDRAISYENAPPLFVFLTFGWLFLATAYFVVFHGMDGRTIGKWLLGLRVVGADNHGISYASALLRWFGFIATLGLGSLWVLVSRQKRSLHDIIAGTWVIRE